jgi:hypothetical protein
MGASGRAVALRRRSLGTLKIALRARPVSQRLRPLADLPAGRARSAGFDGADGMVSPCNDSSDSIKLSSVLEHNRIIEFRQDFDAAFEDIDVFLSGVVDERPELLRALRTYASQDRIMRLRRSSGHT